MLDHSVLTPRSVFLHSCFAPQSTVEERRDRPLLAGIASLHEGAYILLLEELLAIGHDERDVLQNHSLALLDMALNLVALLDEKLNYFKLCIRILHFGENFVDELVAKRARAFAFRGRENGCVSAEAILFAELIWLDLGDLGKEETRVRVNELNTLLCQGECLRTSAMKDLQDVILCFFLTKITDRFICEHLTS